jgi:putative ABC transport system permease protein
MPSGPSFLNLSTNCKDGLMNLKNLGLPKLALRMLRRILPRDDARYLMGDFTEIFEESRAERGVLYARLWIWWQVLIGLPRFIQHHTYWRIQMLRNYLVSALRNLRKDKLHSFVNIAGLSIGLTHLPCRSR